MKYRKQFCRFDNEAYFQAEAILGNAGESMKAARKAKGVPVDVLAKWVDIAPASIRNIENGKVCPRLDTVIRLAVALGLTLDEYIGFPKSEDFATGVASVEDQSDKHEWQLYTEYCGDEPVAYRYGPAWVAMQLYVEGGYPTPEEAKVAWLREWERMRAGNG